MIHTYTQQISEQLDLLTSHLCDALNLPTPVKSALRGGVWITAEPDLFAERMQRAMQALYGSEEALGDDLTTLVLDFHRTLLSVSPHWMNALSENVKPREVRAVLDLPAHLNALFRADVNLPQSLGDQALTVPFTTLVLHLLEQETADLKPGVWLNDIRTATLLPVTDFFDLYQVLCQTAGDRDGSGIHLTDLLWWLWLSLHVASNISTYLTRQTPTETSFQDVLAPLTQTLSLYLNLADGLVIKSARTGITVHPLDLILED